MIKFILIFIFGAIETYLYTGWNLSANKNQVYLSSILMFTYMMVYLKLIEWAFKDENSTLMILAYALACGVGNFIRVYQESKK